MSKRDTLPGPDFLVLQEDVLAPGVTVSSWLEAMRTVDLEAFLGRRGEGERGGSRMLQPCMADLVTVGEGQEVLARVRGRNTVEVA